MPVKGNALIGLGGVRVRSQTVFKYVAHDDAALTTH